MRKRLTRLIIRQHWPLLLGVLVLLLGVGLFQGLTGAHQWQEANSPEILDMQVRDELRYQPKTKTYVERHTNRHYASKAAYLKVYRDKNLQLYRAKPSAETHSIGRGMFGTGLNSYYFFIAIVAGIVMVWYARWRYLNAWLRSLGYRRTQIYQQQSLLYGVTVVAGVILGSCGNLLVLVSAIPSHYWLNFTWQNWLQNLASDSLMSLTLMLAAGLLSLLISNGIVVFAFIAAMYAYWSLPLAFYHQTPGYGAHYLSRHWSVGCGLMLVLIGVTWWASRWLSNHYASDSRTAVVLIPSLRLPVVLLLSLPVGFLLTQVFNGLLIGHTAWPSLIISWLVGLIGLVAWIYRPKWSQRLWQLFA